MSVSKSKLIELAATITDYCVTNEHEGETTVESENGDIVYTHAAQEIFTKRYGEILHIIGETFK